jgi:phosphoesterase RecJ-like protein
MSEAYKTVLETLNSRRNVLITTHVRPDGDALGSVAAMSMGLRKKNIPNEVLILSKLPSKYAFIFTENDISYTAGDGGPPANLDWSRFDALLVVDTGTWSQLPGLKEHINSIIGPKIVVDHHLTQESWADVKLVQTDAAAAGEIVAELLSQWNVPLDRPMATAIFLAIASDTGWFQFSNTRPKTLRLAATLIEAGVDTDQMYQALYQNERSQRIALQTVAQQGLELLADGRLAVMRIAQADFKKTGADVPDTEGLINIPLQIRSVEVSILLVEPKDAGPIRVSLRSKGKVDVAKFAEQFGGGGHARAAGLKLPGTLMEVHDRVVGKMKQAIADQ